MCAYTLVYLNMYVSIDIVCIRASVYIYTHLYAYIYMYENWYESK
jgi:hypothetical protein